MMSNDSFRVVSPVGAKFHVPAHWHPSMFSFPSFSILVSLLFISSFLNSLLSLRDRRVVARLHGLRRGHYRRRYSHRHRGGRRGVRAPRSRTCAYRQ
jgi:hypothetical protein